MIEPGHRLCDALHHAARGQDWPFHHDDGQAQRTRGLQLGARAAAAGILGHDMGNARLLQQGQIIGGGERPTAKHDPAIGQGRGLRRIDQPQQIMMLRPRGKEPRLLLADRQKDPRGRVGQGLQGGLHIRDAVPAVTGLRGPCRALQRDQRQAKAFAGGMGVAAHPGGERMRGVYQMGDALGLHIGAKPRNPAKTPNSCGQGLRHRLRRAPGIGKHRIPPGLGQRAGKGRSLGRAAQKKDACHV